MLKRSSWKSVYYKLMRTCSNPCMSCFVSRNYLVA